MTMTKDWLIDRPVKSALVRPLQCFAGERGSARSCLMLPGPYWYDVKHCLRMGSIHRDAQIYGVEMDAELLETMRNESRKLGLTKPPAILHSRLEHVTADCFECPLDLAYLDCCNAPSIELLLWFREVLQHNIVKGSPVAVTLSRRAHGRMCEAVAAQLSTPHLRAKLSEQHRWLTKIACLRTKRGMPMVATPSSSTQLFALLIRYACDEITLRPECCIEYAEYADKARGTARGQAMSALRFSVSKLSRDDELDSQIERTLNRIFAS